MKKILQIALLLTILLALVVGVAQAQDSPKRGTIQGLVYEDVDGDGKCVDTGVEGENPVEGVDIVFTSSDEQTIVTLYSGPEGIYGLFAAGQSYWRVEAKPSAEWVVTSENPLWAPLDDENRAVTGVNFCVQKASAVDSDTTAAPILLPVSGAANNGLTTIALVIGFIFISLGATLEWRRRRAG